MNVQILYANEDLSFVEQLDTELSKHGIVCVYRRKLDVGLKTTDSSQLKPKVEIFDFNFTLAVLSPASTEPHFLEKEFLPSFTLNVRVIPLLIQNTDIPLSLTNYRYVDFAHQEFEVAFSQLLSRIGIESPKPHAPVNIFFSSEIFSKLSASSIRAIKIAENLRRQIKHNPDGHDLFSEMMLIGLSELSNHPTEALFMAHGIGRTELLNSIRSSRHWETPEEISLDDLGDVLTDISKLPYSTNARQILEKATSISAAKHSSAIRTRHILAALLEQKECVAYKWLEEQLIGIESIHQVLLTMPESDPITIATFSFAPGIASADSPAKQDALGFRLYAQALADIIIKNETIPPIVFGIYGPWGSGKSTLMCFVKDILDEWEKAKKRKSGQKWKSPKIVCVHFNAWAYTDSAKLWTGLVTEIASQIEKQIPWWNKTFYWLGKNARRFAGTMVLILLPALIGIFVSWVLPSLSTANNLDIIRAIISLAGLIGSARLAANQKPLSEVVKIELAKLNKSDSAGIIKRIQDHLHSTIERYFKLSEQEIKIADKISEDLKSNAFPKYQDKLKIVVFIDELDRCPMEKIVDILESIKLFLAEDIFIVLMAVDTRVASEAIRLHYKEVENPELAREYLEKIIQVPIPVPVPNVDELRSYVGSLMRVKNEKPKESKSLNVKKTLHRFPTKSDEQRSPKPVIPAQRFINIPPEPFRLLELEDTPAEEEAITSFSQRFLSSNPRRIKRLINTYRYVKILATRRGIHTDQKNWQISMIHWLGATMQWPYFMEEAIKLAETDCVDEKSFWGKVSVMVEEGYCPPNDIIDRLPLLQSELIARCSLADNFIKENPPRLTTNKRRGLMPEEKI